MVYDLITASKDYGANFKPFLQTRTTDLLLDYQRGYEVDKDELIELLVTDYFTSNDSLNGELAERDLTIS